MRSICPWLGVVYDNVSICRAPCEIEKWVKSYPSVLGRLNTTFISVNLPVNVLSRTPILQGKCVSQPQTPSEERKSILDPPRTPGPNNPPPFNFNLPQPWHAPLGLSQSHGGGSLGTPGKTMRDYDESFKEMKKENFNLKLRIFFLEERMGLGKKSTAEELAATNLDLKVSHFIT